MKKSKIDRVISVVVIGICLLKAVLYGGSKPLSAPTNTPHCTAAVLSGGRGNGVGLPAPAAESGGGTVLTAAPEMTNLPPSTSTSNLNLITNWTARGAYCDWQPITFSDGFRFPVGTNLVDAVTLFAWGEVAFGRGRTLAAPQSLTNEIALCGDCGEPGVFALPARVSIEPNASSVQHWSK